MEIIRGKQKIRDYSAYSFNPCQIGSRGETSLKFAREKQNDGVCDAMKCRTEGKFVVNVGQILQNTSLMLRREK